MKYRLYRNERTIVNLMELAFRFRETTRDMNRTLTLLEKHGLAERADLSSRGQVHVTELDQHSTWFHPTGPRSAE